MTTFTQTRTCSCGASATATAPFPFTGTTSDMARFLDEHRRHGQQYTAEDIDQMRFLVQQITNWERVHMPFEASALHGSDVVEDRLRTYLANGTTPDELETQLDVVRGKANDLRREAESAAAQARHFGNDTRFSGPSSLLRRPGLGR